MRKLIFILTAGLFLIGCLNKTETKGNVKAVNHKMQIEIDSSGIEIGLKFINDYVANCNEMRNAKRVEEWTTSNPYGSEQLKNELQRIMEEASMAEPELGLGFDPLFDAQDYPEKGFEIESIDANSGYIVIKGKDMEGFRITMKLIKKNNKWFVDGCGIVNIPKERQRNTE